MNGGVGDIFEGSGHLLSHFCLCEIVGMDNVDSYGEFLDVAMFNEFSGPVVLPVVPSFLVNWAMTSFTPSLLEVVALGGMHGTCGYHGWLRDGNCSVRCEVLTHFFFRKYTARWRLGLMP